MRDPPFNKPRNISVIMQWRARGTSGPFLTGYLWRSRGHLERRAVLTISRINCPNLAAIIGSNVHFHAPAPPPHPSIVTWNSSSFLVTSRVAACPPCFFFLDTRRVGGEMGSVKILSGLKLDLRTWGGVMKISRLSLFVKSFLFSL
jgi:hypothetical protein